MEAVTGEEFLFKTGYTISSVFFNIPQNYSIKRINVEHYLWVNRRTHEVTFAPSLNKEFMSFTALGENEEEVSKLIQKIEDEIEKNYKCAIEHIHKFTKLVNDIPNTIVGIIGSTAHKLCDKTEDLDILIITPEKHFEEARRAADRIYFSYVPYKKRNEIDIDIGILSLEKLEDKMENPSLIGIIYAKYIDELLNPCMNEEINRLKSQFSGTSTFKEYKLKKEEVIKKRKAIAKSVGF